MKKVIRTATEVAKLNDVKKRLASAQKKLEKMENDGKSDVLAIESQRGVVKQLQELVSILSEAPIEKAKGLQAANRELPIRLAETGEVCRRKLARVKHNRPVNQKDVDDFISIIANGEYEEAYPVIATEANPLIAAGYEVVDYSGNTITAEEAADYLVILDGQHRCKAFAQLNATGTEFVIPNVHIKEVEDVAKFLININKAGKHWDKSAKFSVASLVAGEEPFTSISNRIAEGFNPTTSMLIYTGRKISDTILNKVLGGEPYKLSKKAVVDIERGDKFITLCKAAGMDVKLITKRYFIEGFNCHCISVGEEKAFKALENLKNLEDKEARFKAVKDNTDFIALLAEASR